MTDRYADLRAALDVLTEEAHRKGGSNPRSQMIIDLLADYDRMRAALQREAVYHEGQEKAHHVWAKNTNGVYDALKVEWHKERAQQIRAALAQEGS
ncbi:MAG: hypothetical protein KUL86_06815 [Castellaniella sp.]|nr:hypothetical protein [Castellaniella sp.]